MRHEQSSVWSRVSVCPIWILSLYIKIQTLAEALLDESGQDLIEYVLVASLISLAAIIGVKSVATAVGDAFTGIGTKLGTYIS
jgi:pilus assembly protein Flp/PilA